MATGLRLSTQAPGMASSGEKPLASTQVERVGSGIWFRQQKGPRQNEGVPITYFQEACLQAQEGEGSWICRASATGHTASNP